MITYEMRLGYVARSPQVPRYALPLCMMRLARYCSSPPLIRGSARVLKTNGGPPASRGALVVRALRKGPAGIPPVLVISLVSSKRV